MNELLVQRFSEAIECVCKHYDRSHPGEQLIGLGLICGDDVTSFAPFLLSRSDVPDDAEADYRFNPVDWENTEGADCFSDLNAMLRSMRVLQGSPEHGVRVHATVRSSL